MTTKNVHQKLLDVRLALQELKLKKSGKNEFSKFSYYELSDFLPSLNKLAVEHGLLTNFYIEPKNGERAEQASLEIINANNPDEAIVFCAPTAEVEIGRKKDGTGGAEPIQNLGGKITYMRRYLLMMAFEIVESDYVERQEQKAPLELDPESIKKIEDTKTVEELIAVCRELKEKKGARYHNLLTRYYTEKKQALEEIITIKVNDEVEKGLEEAK